MFYIQSLSEKLYTKTSEHVLLTELANLIKITKDLIIQYLNIFDEDVNTLNKLFYFIFKTGPLDPVFWLNF